MYLLNILGFYCFTCILTLKDDIIVNKNNIKFFGGDNMSNVYDLAHRLARAIKDSDEYKNYFDKKKILDSDKKNKQMVEDFKKKALTIQMDKMAGKDVKEELEKLNNLEQVLMLNPTISEFLQAELRFSQMVQDITKIIGEAIDLEKDQ